ncbi:MAG: MFS transporter, partial [Pusillimonas sp.]
MTTLTNAIPPATTANTTLSTRSKAWLVTAMLTGFMVLNFGDKAVLGLVAKPAMAELGLTPVQFGFIGSSFFFLFSVSAILVGAFAGRMSSRW